MKENVMSGKHLRGYMKSFVYYIALTCVLLITHQSLLITAYSQSATANLSGVVEDQNGGVIPSASVTAVNTATTLQRQTKTSDGGYFSIPLLPPGTYVIRVEAQGFTPLETRDVVLNVGDQKSLQIQLKAGDVKAEVQITTDALLVDISPAIGTVVDRQFVENLPLNGRSFQSLILLAPGVVVTTSNNLNPGQFSVNGQRSNSNYYTVDGVSANTGAFSAGSGSGVFSTTQTLSGSLPGLTTFGGTNGLVSIDALQEFKIQTSTYSAEFGRQPGGQISLITRSGTNQFHGSIFDYLRNDVFDANDWFANAAGKKKAPLRQNQLGGTFSGPILVPRFGEGGRQPGYNGRNRTFFFISYEGLRLRLPQAVVTTVPSLRLRQVAAPATHPALNAFPLPSGPELLGSTGQPLGFSPFTGVYSDPSTLNATSIRIDHTVNEKLTLFGRFNYSSSLTATRISAGLSQIDESQITGRGLTLGSTMAFTPTLSNELRFNMTKGRSGGRSRLDDFEGAVPVDLAPVINPNFSSLGSDVRSIIQIFTPFGTESLRQGPFDAIHQRQINVVDTLSLVTGGHQLKLGIDYRRLSPTFRPTSFQNVIFSVPQQFINSTPLLAQIAAFQGARPLFTNISLYGQDTWKLSRRLTLDLGLRWEINPAPGEADGKKPVVLTGLDNLPTATLAHQDAPIYETYYRAFAPRIGAAYLLSNRNGWERVLRGGFGVFYDTGQSSAVLGFYAFPFISQIVSINVPFPLPPAQATPPTPVVRLPITQGLSVVNPNLKPPYTLEWNLSLEQSLGPNQTISASYVASAGRRLIAKEGLNGATASGQRPNPNLRLIDFITNGATSDYKSLQLQYQRRLSRGLQALVNYTWSHAIDEVSDEVQFGILERGDAAFDVRHNFSAAITYNLPTPRASAFLDSVLRKWWVDAIVHAQSATPVNLSGGSQFTREDGTVISPRPDLVEGVHLYVNDPTVPGGRRFNSAAFRTPPAGRQGTLGRNVLRGLPLYQVDMALRRQFNFTERLNMQFRAEAFNLFNHPNFGGLGTNISSPSTLGVPTQMLGRSLGGLSPIYQIGGPRSFQFSLRLSF